VSCSGDDSEADADAKTSGEYEYCCASGDDINSETYAHASKASNYARSKTAGK
jgi:hypothetical protein